MRLSIVSGLIIALVACSQIGDPTLAWPGDDQVHIMWELRDDAVNGDDKQSSVFTITNAGDTAMSNNWQLYFSQFPTAFYLPVEAEYRYDIEAMGGDLYRINTLDSFPVIQPGESIKITYQWPVGRINRSFMPHGLFFVLGDGSVHPVTNYRQSPIPETLTFSTSGGRKPLHISPEKRFSRFETISDFPAGQLSPVLPTPRHFHYGQGNYALRPGVTVTHDPGLENEAANLVELLNQVLQDPVVIGPQNTVHENGIYLKLDSLGGITDPEGYQLLIGSRNITVTGRTAAGVFYGVQSLKALVPPAYYRVPATEILLPAISIDDAPGFSYRGQHLDVARNFQPASEIKRIIRLMAFYKLNKLHFHLTDDEGWRLEIPGLPELTSVGAQRGYSAQKDQMLPPAYGSGGLAGAGNGSGFYSRAEFIDILRFARQHHIEVIPEINGPGHARAAIVAMEARYRRLMAEGKESDARAYLLNDLNDASQYISAQNYRDNVICVCQEYTYTFLEKVVAELVSMYREAEAPLKLIHTGGDEVPQGAWTGSPECDRLIRDESYLQSAADLHAYFVQRYLDIAAKYDLKIGGWEEIVLRHTRDGLAPNMDLLNRGILAYAWNAIVGSGGEDIAYQLANAGYDVVMCNASNLYFDLAYTHEPEETGLFWAGFVDTRNAFEFTPYHIFLSMLEDEMGNPMDGLALARESVSLNPDAKANILGIQGALWSETLKNQEMFEYALLPKMLGLAERAWVSSPPWADLRRREDIEYAINREWSKFANRLGKIELPRLDYLNEGYLYRISPPGAKIDGDHLLINAEFPGLQLRYTLDGSDPDHTSPLYTGPVEVKNAGVIRIRAFNSNNRASRVVEITREIL